MSLYLLPDLKAQSLLTIYEKDSTSHIINPHLFQMTSSQSQTFNNLNHVLEVLKGNYQSPAELISIPSDKISSAIEDYEDIFKRQIEEYTSGLEDVKKDDLKLIENLRSKHKVIQLCKPCEWMFPIIKIFNKSYMTPIEFEREGSAYRVKWLLEVDIKEKMRLDYMERDIPLRICRLQFDLTKLNEQNMTDMDLLTQAQQLTKLYQALFPNNQNEKVEEMASFIANMPENILELTKECPFS